MDPPGSPASAVDSGVVEAPGAALVPGPLAVQVHVRRAAWGSEMLFDALDLELRAGEITCLLGPSGVGKSTLLKLLAGHAPQDADLRVHCADGGLLAGRVAWMDQRDLLMPWLDVTGNVTIGARLRGERPDKERAHALIAAVGLAGREHAAPATLSGGMRQRVALARTLMEPCPLVLMDEPFSALDALTRHRLQALAVELLAKRTVLMVTHDPAEAVRVGHRIHVMQGLPARLGEPLVAPGKAPRDPSSDRCLPLLRDLLARLGLRDGGRAA